MPRSHPQEDGLADACSKVPLLAKNLKMVALRTQTPLRDKEQWRYTCAHPERDEAVDSERQRRRCDKEGTTPRRAFGGLTGFICTEVRKFSRRCTFGELGSLAVRAACACCCTCGTKPWWRLKWYQGGCSRYRGACSQNTPATITSTAERVVFPFSHTHPRAPQ